jgi:SAM-dependent methyltransferase
MEHAGLYGEHAEQYDRIYSGKDYAAEARWLAGIARRIQPSARTLLDVACGTGRHLETFRRSFSVEGLDASAPLLAVARRRLGRSVPLVQSDMRSFDRGREYDVLVCLFSAIGYLLTPSDRRRTFETFFHHLAPGGVALVEGWILPSKFRDGSVHLTTYDGPNAKIARVSTGHRLGRFSRIEMEYLVAERGGSVRHWREVHRNALVEPSEMLRTMRQVGFRARLLRGGSYRDRGLYVGVRPPGATKIPRLRSGAGGPRAR